MSDMKSIWHKLPEQPEKGRDVLEKWHHLGITHYTHFVAKNGIAEDNPFTDAWCYLDDMLALEPELERTRKALDVAKDALKYLYDTNDDYVPGFAVPCGVKGYTKQKIDEITALEQKD